MELRRIALVTHSSDITELTIELNGNAMRVPCGTTIAALVTMTLPEARAYAVELNRSVLPRRDHAAREVREGDRIEIVTLVGGG
jgi:thiamine biosynthesis protein ThiS